MVEDTDPVAVQLGVVHHSPGEVGVSTQLVQEEHSGEKTGFYFFVQFSAKSVVHLQIPKLCQFYDKLFLEVVLMVILKQFVNNC